MSEGVRREPDAAPCDVIVDVIVAEFVFGGSRCREDAVHTVEYDGEHWRICARHLRTGRFQR